MGSSGLEFTAILKKFDVVYWINQVAGIDRIKTVRE
jgi:hypothetical protein